MVTRRSLLTGGVFAGIAGAGSASTVQATPRAGQSSRGGDEQVARVLEEIRDELRLQRGACSPAECGVVATIRGQQKTFLKSRGKFPDFIDVGIDVWESVYDWHIKAGQKPEVSRTADGRHAMAFMLTSLVLRHDMTGSYIGLGYEGKAETT